MKKAMILLMIIVLTLSYKVNASEYQKSEFMTYYKDANKTQNYSNLSGGIYSYSTENTKTSETITFVDTNFYFDRNLNVSQYAGGYISFPFQVKLPIVNMTFTENSQQDYCTAFNCATTNNGVCTRYTCANTGISSGNVGDAEYVTPTTMFQPIMYFEVLGANYWVTCDIDNTTNTIKCPIKSDMTAVNRLRISSYVYYPVYQKTYDLNLGKNISIYASGTKQIIENQNQNTQTIINEMNQTQTYTEDMNTNMTGVNETIEYSQQEQTLKSQLDLNTSMLDDLYIDSSTSGFIWDLVGGLRNMNPAIITLMSTMLGLGVIRLILNR